MEIWELARWDAINVGIVFEEPESGVTVVKLTHTDVPEEDRINCSWNGAYKRVQCPGGCLMSMELNFSKQGPRNWNAPANKRSLWDYYDVGKLSKYLCMNQLFFS